MTKEQDIDEILVTRPTDLLIDALWADSVIVDKIRTELNKVSVADIKHYHEHFCGKSE